MSPHPATPQPPGVRVLLLGDSHLAWIPWDTGRLAPGTGNAAFGGADVHQLPGQYDRAGPADLVVLSVGSNDAVARMPLAEFAGALGAFLDVIGLPSVLVAPPGVDEELAQAAYGLDGAGLNALMGSYRDAAAQVVRQRGGAVVPTDELIAPLGAAAFEPDGLHLSPEGYAALLPALAAALADPPRR